MAAERLSRGRLSFGAGVPPRRFWNGRIPNTGGEDGQTPPVWAVIYGHDIGSMLLEREDAVPNTANNSGRTLLLWATGMGYAGIVEILLEPEDSLPTPLIKMVKRLSHGQLSLGVGAL